MEQTPIRMAVVAAILVGGAMLFVACTDVDIHHVPFHACDDQYKDWTGTGIDFRLEHTNPGLCPSTKGPGDDVEAGGALYETNAPSAPHIGLSKTGFLRVYDTYNYNSWSGSQQLGSDTESFQWGPPCCGASTGQDWRAWLLASYTADNNPDYAEFTMDFYSTPPGDPVGVIEITYQGEPE